jgi:hypothetical protein
MKCGGYGLVSIEEVRGKNVQTLEMESGSGVGIAEVRRGKIQTFELEVG